MLERRLSCDEGAAQVDLDHAVELLDRRLLEFLWDGRAGVIDEHVELTQYRDCLFHCSGDLIRGRRVSLHGDRLASRLLDRRDDRSCPARSFGVGDGDHGAVGSRALGDRSADPP